MSLPIFCWVATGDSNMFNSYGHFYQALNMPASAVYDETSLVRKALTVRRGIKRDGSQLCAERLAHHGFGGTSC